MDVKQLPGIRKYAQKSDISDRLTPRWLPLLMLAGLALRAYAANFRFAVSFDEVNYLKLGVSGYLNGFSDVFHTYWSPLLPACIAFFCHFFEDYEFAARLVSILAGVLVFFPIYGIGKHVWDEKVGVVAAGFFALFPPLAFQSTAILTEPLVMLFGALSVFFGLHALQRYSVANTFLAGVSGGLAYLAHPAGIGFVLLLGAWLVFAQFSKLFLIRRLRLAYLITALAIGFLVVATPYLHYLKEATGAWTLSAKGAANLQMEAPNETGIDTFRSLNEDNTMVPIDLVFHQGGFLKYASSQQSGAVREVRFGALTRKFVRNFANVLQRGIPQVLTTLPLMLFGIGLLGSAWRVQQGKFIFFLASFLVFYWLLLVPAFHIHLRYLSPVWPICVVFIAAGLLAVYGWLSQYMAITKMTWRKRLTASTVAATLVLGAVGLLSFLPEFGRIITRTPQSKEYVADPVGQKAAGLWLRKNAKRKPVIMSRNHTVDFYAGNYDIASSVTVPKNDLARVLAYARNRGVSHLVLNERYQRDYPQLALLFANGVSHEGLREIYRHRDDSGLLTVIYELQ